MRLTTKGRFAVTAMIDFLDFTYISPVPNWTFGVYVAIAPLTMDWRGYLRQRNADLLPRAHIAIR